MSGSQQWLMPDGNCQSARVIGFSSSVMRKANIATASDLIQLEMVGQVQLDREGELRRCLKSQMNLRHRPAAHTWTQIKDEILYQQQSMQVSSVRR